jgi:Ni,Fe-hydrogenase I small subunit
MPTREQLLSCVKEFKQNNDPITIKKVADKCGISHSLIYNRHPDIKEMINNLKKKQKEQTLVDQQKDQTGKLLKRNENLERKLSEAKKNDDKETIAMLITHIQELYSMYDSLLEERNAFANRLYDIEND